jgi:hypothetical protein
LDGALTAKPFQPSKVNVIYALVALALAVSVACSYAASLAHLRLHAKLLERVFMVASIASFASIGCLAVAARALTDPDPRAAAARATLPESRSDREIVGLRAWRANGRGPAFCLHSWHIQHAFWPPGQAMQAEPASLGIHAFKTGAGLLDYIGSEIGGANVVVGTVALWGTVIEHDHGWTAEKAYPIEVYAASAETAAAIRAAYGCESAVAAGGMVAAVTRLATSISVLE